MGHIFHLIASQPLATTVTGLSLLLVTSLLLSDWAEKRRERQFLLARVRLRRGNPDPALDKAIQENRPVFRLFRWEFLLLSLALVGLLAPNDGTNTLRISARKPASTSVPTSTSLAVESGIQLPSLSLRLPVETPADFDAFELGPAAHASEPAVLDFTLFSSNDPDKERVPGSSISAVPAAYRPWSPM